MRQRAACCGIVDHKVIACIALPKGVCDLSRSALRHLRPEPKSFPMFLLSLGSGRRHC
jgi:hypothetical protein